MIIVEVAGVKSVLRDGRVDMSMLWESLGKPANKSPSKFLNGTNRYRYKGKFAGGAGYICDAEVALNYVYWMTDGETGGEQLHEATEAGDRLARVSSELKSAIHEKNCGMPGAIERARFMAEMLDEIIKVMGRK